MLGELPTGGRDLFKPDKEISGLELFLAKTGGVAEPVGVTEPSGVPGGGLPETVVAVLDAGL